MSQEGIDTIAAISTPLGEAGIGVVRLSGPKAKEILKKIFSHPSNELSSHHLYHGWIIDPKSKVRIDEVLASLMQAPNSYTGEDVVEISCHGGTVILNSILEAGLKEGARLAERGEFTKRAFLSGRIDLAQAEAVIDLIKAPTRESASAAGRQLEGQLSKGINNLREEIKTLLAGIEANLDFPDEVEDINHEAANVKIGVITAKIISLLETADTGRLLREGISTVIIGRPNVGKSSLLNALLREERAIVTEIPGTTRDTIEEKVALQGLCLNIIDTAGLRHPKDQVEKAGIERAKEKLSWAELVLLVLDASEGITEEDKQLLKEIAEKKAILVLNKIDKGLSTGIEQEQRIKGVPKVKVSALTGQGIKDLEEAIINLVASKKILAANEPIITRVRHKECLIRAKEALEKAMTSLKQGLPPDFLAIDLKDAMVALGEVTGEEASEEVINQIFEEFCVGK